jgi:hypothetical protein
MNINIYLYLYNSKVFDIFINFLKKITNNLMNVELAHILWYTPILQVGK